MTTIGLFEHLTPGQRNSIRETLMIVVLDQWTCINREVLLLRAFVNGDFVRFTISGLTKQEAAAFWFLESEEAKKIARGILKTLHEKGK